MLKSDLHMTVFADLGPISYFPVPDATALRAVGWLGRGHEFPVAPADRHFFDKLCLLLVAPFEPLTSFGSHRCDLCQFSGGPGTLRNGDAVVQMGASNLFVPGRGVVYVAPSLIAHYIDAHGYRPPDEFVEAVLQCPDPRSMDYKRLLLASGGRGLVRPSRAR